MQMSIVILHLADNDSFIGGIFASLNESDLKELSGAAVEEELG